MEHPRTRRYLRLLLLAAFVGLVLRLAVAFELLGHPSVTSPDSRTDMSTYERLATEILAGGWPDHFYYQPFYYAVFLPSVHSVFGLNEWSIPVAQALLGAASVALAGAATARLFGRATGVGAAVLLALARFHVFYTPFSLMAVLLGFELILFAYLLIRAVQRGGWGYWASTSLALACASLTRGNCALFVPVVLGLALWQSRRQWPRAIALGVLVLAVFYAPQMPFSVRNYQHYGRWTGPSSAADAVLALSNSPQAPPGGLAPNTRVYKEWMQDARASGEDRVPVKDRVLQWVRREPAAFLELKWQTFLLFWSAAEIPNNVAMAHEGRESAIARLPFPLMLDFSVLGSLGIAGLLFSLPRLRGHPARLSAVLVVGVGCAATVAFYMLARFRVPLLPFLCIFAAYALNRLVLAAADLLEAKRMSRRRLLGITAAFVVGGYVCNAGFAHYQVVEPAVLRVVRPHGVAFETDEGALVHDHGPRLTGGWVAFRPPAGAAALRKEFVLPGWLRGVEWAERYVEVGVLTAEGRSWRWLRLPVAPVRPEEGRLVFEIPLQADSRPPPLILDTDRDYRRTLLRGAEMPVRGELVARLVLVSAPPAIVRQASLSPL